MLASMTAWICCLLPAVMLEMVQHASFLINQSEINFVCVNQSDRRISPYQPIRDEYLPDALLGG